MRNKRLWIWGMLGWLLVFPAACRAHDPDLADNGGRTEPSVFMFPLEFYQKVISPAVGNRCTMVPSCSEYSKEAFHAHGFFLGWFMTCDRLMRCGRDETRLSPGVPTPEGRLTPDPLSANDFWMK